jgi:hypothetical protein
LQVTNVPEQIFDTNNSPHIKAIYDREFNPMLSVAIAYPEHIGAYNAIMSRDVADHIELPFVGHKGVCLNHYSGGLKRLLMGDAPIVDILNNVSLQYANTQENQRFNINELVYGNWFKLNEDAVKQLRNKSTQQLFDEFLEQF